MQPFTKLNPMSTFQGIVAEFPHIRIDYFRQQPGHKAPLACFLSHVHSDHLIGLDSIKAPFVYCSAATREILLRLEKRHYRVNYAKGLLESRNVTYDKSMRKLAKPLPLETPTEIELAPGNTIRVTLVDANHCIGAVMFLIEGDGKAILYTGDIRAEAWWVNSLVQNPVLLPYTLGSRRLNCIYLDTTFANGNEPYREFPSKAEGIRELLEKVCVYDDDTVFYFHSWTFGYENVWIALSAFLKSQIHVDAYRARVYGSLSTLDKKQLQESGLEVPAGNKFLQDSGLDIREAPALCGFRNGNHIQPGCLTSREDVRIHSCEHGMGCQVMENDANAKIVHIIPIITRSKGVEIAELGAGNGPRSMDPREGTAAGGMSEVDKLMERCAQFTDDEGLHAKAFALLQRALNENHSDIDLNMGKQPMDNLSLQGLISALSSYASTRQHVADRPNRVIRFPFSRHSSYSELCSLLGVFKPMDVVPCTVDEDDWSPAVSMRNLFGEYCSHDVFRHDAEMTMRYELRLVSEGKMKRGREETQDDTQSTDELGDGSSTAPKRMCLEQSEAVPADAQISLPAPSTLPGTPSPLASPTSGGARKRRAKVKNRKLAYEAAVGTYLTWNDYGGLESTRSKADRQEQEL